MTQLTFYGGIDEIGGNKILLEDGEHRLLLDFGFPYKKYGSFYEEYLRPRGAAGLLDPLVMGLLPPLEGLYRRDLATPELWQQFHSSHGYRKLDHVDAVLLTHAHLDHSGHISFLSEDIPIFSTTATAFITKAMQDSGKADMEHQVCYFNPMERGQPKGWRQSAYRTDRTEPSHQRQFCLADVELENLNAEAAQFWGSGFWEKTAQQRKLAACSLGSHGSCSFNLRCFPVDHSIPGACAWGIETSSGWIVYSGDVRRHGKRAGLTQSFVEQASRLKPRVLILEGTNVGRETNVTEQEVYENALKAVTGARSLVIADFSPRDIDRLLTFRQIARDTGRKLAILPKDAYLLKTMRLLEPEIPDIAVDDSLVIYQDTSAAPSSWQQNLCQGYASKIVLAEDVRSAQHEFILCFSLFDLNELPEIHPEAGSLYIYSSSEPHSEEQAIDFKRLHNWLDYFKIRGFGLPLEIKIGEKSQWEIPEAEKGLHASGHACSRDLLEIAHTINPEILFPVHSEAPQFYVEQLSGTGIKVNLPVLGQAMVV
jgi:ribonuclease J